MSDEGHTGDPVAPALARERARALTAPRAPASTARKPSWLRLVDWPIVLPTACLLLVGVIFIWSVSQSSGSTSWMRQMIFVGVGVVVVAVVGRVGTGWLARHAWGLYAISLAVLLVLPFVAAPTGTGSARWIRLPFGFQLQPSEFMKVALLLVLARHLRHAGVTNTWRSYLTPFGLTVVPWFLVMRQPDLGSSLVLLPVFVSMVCVSGARLGHLALVVVGVLVLLPAAYFVPGVLEQYQRERIDAFLTPIDSMVVEARELREARQHQPARDIERRITELKRGTGRQQFFSVVAIGSGGLVGAGLTRGVQNQGNFLPAQRTDFIFAVIGEEWGLAGTTLVLILYLVLVTAILIVARRTREPFGRLVCVGVAALIGGQAWMHLGINTGLLPVTGLTLPFVSYGGSSVLSSMIAVGLVLDVARRRAVVFFEE